MRVSSLVTEKIKIKIQLCQSAQRLTECVNVHSRATGPQGHTSWRALHLEKADCTTDLSNLYVRPTPLTCLVYTPNLMPNLLSLSLSLSLMANTHTHTLKVMPTYTHTLKLMANIHAHSLWVWCKSNTTHNYGICDSNTDTTPSYIYTSGPLTLIGKGLQRYLTL